jgi:hypothetical protein
VADPPAECSASNASTSHCLPAAIDFRYQWRNHYFSLSGSQFFLAKSMLFSPLCALVHRKLLSAYSELLRGEFNWATCGKGYDRSARRGTGIFRYVCRIFCWHGTFATKMIAIPKRVRRPSQMIGTTRSRFFCMNRFRKLGFIDYDGETGLQFRSSLLSTSFPTTSAL